MLAVRKIFCKPPWKFIKRKMCSVCFVYKIECFAWSSPQNPRMWLNYYRGVHVSMLECIITSKKYWIIYCSQVKKGRCFNFVITWIVTAVNKLYLWSLLDKNGLEKNPETLQILFQKSTVCKIWSYWDCRLKHRICVVCNLLFWESVELS